MMMMPGRKEEADEEEDTLELRVSYQARDAILYALSIGFGSDAAHYAADLAWTFEQDPHFTVFPTLSWALALAAVPPSQHGSTAAGSLSQPRPFPPPSIQWPCRTALAKFWWRNFSERIEEENQPRPILHMSTRLQCHQPLPVPSSGPVILNLRVRVLSIVPKSVGVLVTSQTEFFHPATNRPPATRGKVPLCTVHNTLLLPGLLPPPSSGRGLPKRSSPGQSTRPSSTAVTVPSTPPAFERIITVTTAQALLYRMASGDTNTIHVVDPTTDPMLQALLLSSEKEEEGPRPEPDQARRSGPSRGPLLHGLCTLGLAVRFAWQYVQSQSPTPSPDANPPSSTRLQLQQVAAQFVGPVWIHDRLWMKFWPDRSEKDPSVLQIRFEVCQAETHKLVLKDGVMVIRLKSPPTPSAETKSDELFRPRL